MVTETDASYELDSAPSALFAADTYLTFLESGLANVDWWDLHNGAATLSTDADGSRDYGDEGLLSNGSCSASTREPTANTLFPTYYGLKAAGDFATSGAEMIAATSSNSTVTGYAVKQPGGAVNVMLINHSATAPEPISLAYNGLAPNGVTSAEQFGAATKQLSTLSSASTSTLTLPAYSITVLKLAGSTATSSPSSKPSASPTPSTSCAVTATKTDDWGTGSTENLTIKNTGATAVSNRKLAFAFPSNEQIGNSWNATYHQSGQAALAHPVNYDTTIAAGAPVTIGYSATYSGTDSTPTWYAPDGTRCG